VRFVLGPTRCMAWVCSLRAGQCLARVKLLAESSTFRIHVHDGSTLILKITPLDESRRAKQ
jgi:hypothetical protein